MRLFWELVKRSFQRQLAYRAAAVAGLATNFFFGILRASVMVALYGARAEVDGITLQGAITYTGLAQALIAYLSLFNWYEVMFSVSSGEIASDLLRPMGYYNFWIAQDLGRALNQILLRGLPIMVAYAVFWGITLPETIPQWLAFLLALLLAWWVSFSWRFLVNLAAFWTPNALGIARLAFLLSWFLSGFMMPLRFFPDWFVQLCYLTPFPHTINTVVEIYLGVLGPHEVVQALGGQLLWILVLWAAGLFTLRAGVRRLVIQGG
jgi:ABC-2 type transport system permease protein